MLEIKQEGFDMQLPQQLAHAGVFNNGAVVDDPDVAAQLLSLFQIMRGEDDGGALLIKLGKKAPH